MAIDDRPTMTEHAWRLTVLDRVVGARQLPVEIIGQPGAEDPGAPAPHYEVIGKLGKGGMALVLDARQTSLEREVALKVFRPSQEEGADITEELKQFAAEAVYTARLDHPNIVPIYSLAKDHRGRLFFTMKKVDGTPWRFLLHPEELKNPDLRAQVQVRAETLDWQDHLRILLKVMDAVAYAHSKGILHRDLKPSNIMVGDFGEVYVMDWGLAMPFGPDAGLQDEANENGEMKVAGTLRYMAPEMVKGQRSRFSEATDVHLLGGILFEIATGRPPRAGKNTHEIIAAAVAGRIEDPARVPGAVHVTPHIRRIILKAMHAEPAERYANVTVMRADIESYLVHADAITRAEEATLDLASVVDDLLVPTPDGGEKVRKLDREQAVLAYDRLSECISRLKNSLRRFPHNGEARSGLFDALILQIRLAIDQGDLTLAEAQVRGLSEVPGPGTDAMFTRTVQGQIQAQGMAIHKERRRRKGTFKTARWLKPAVVVLLLLAVAGMAFGYMMADIRREEAIQGEATMFQVAVQGRARMIEQFLVEVERLTEQYRGEAVALLSMKTAELEAVKQTAAGRDGYYLDADFYDPRTEPPDLAPLAGDPSGGRFSLTHPTVVMAPWVQNKEQRAFAEADAARLSRLGRRFGQAHRTFGPALKWSLAGTTTGLLVGFPGSGRYKDKPQYDPTARPWFKLAIDAPDDNPRWGAPYTDATTQMRIIPCIARLRVGEATMGVVGVEVTLAKAQEILGDFAQDGDAGLRAILLRPGFIEQDGEKIETLTVLIDTAEETQGSATDRGANARIVTDLDPEIRRFVAQVVRDRERSPLVVGDRLFTHAFLETHEWLLVVTTRHDH